ncbi:hypothetical protein B0H63DRAFT_98594 [Podospora didyma]|uniref:Secreted protein n=1 Tax=Podospora didyma TaxID=330526 RepID=A0AAE0NX75_9PEZI|nr:hypothetical protein B0H63DRAFT_98594 [Podospora didyma]
MQLIFSFLFVLVRPGYQHFPHRQCLCHARQLLFPTFPSQSIYVYHLMQSNIFSYRVGLCPFLQLHSYLHLLWAARWLTAAPTEEFGISQHLGLRG